MALTADRDTKAQGKGGLKHQYNLPVAATTTIFQGSMVGINASGYLVPASADSAIRIVGMAKKRVVNSGSAGDVSCPVETGIFKWANSSTTGAITAADIGRDAYAVDDETVSRISAYGARPVAGRIVEVDSAGVWVETGEGLGRQGHDGNVDILMIAGSDLSSAQYLAVALASDGEVDIVGAAGAMITGILQNAPEAAAVAIVRVAGISKWIASGSINPGVALAAATTTGKSKAAVVSDDSAVGSNAFAIALTAGATDTAHNVLIARQGLLPATAA
jgi:hypothetical protein